MSVVPPFFEDDGAIMDEAAASSFAVPPPPHVLSPRIPPAAAHDAAAPPPLEAGSVFLSVVEDGPSLSFCAYNEDENTIYVETSHADGYEVSDLIERVLVAIRPTMLLLPNKIVSNHEFLALLTKSPAQLEAVPDRMDDDYDMEEVDGSGGAPTTNVAAARTTQHRPNDDTTRAQSIPYRIIKTASLDVRACKSVIMKLRVRSMERRQNQQHQHHQQHHYSSHHQQQQQQQQRTFPLAPPHVHGHSFEVSHYHSLASIIDFDSKVQVQAMGSLLSFLQTTVFQHVPGGLLPVNDVVQLQTSLFMKINADTLSALHIFAVEYHPLVAAKGSGHAKEGCSLFSLLDRTRTHAGRQRLREWMLKPLLSVEAIQMRQDGVELFLRPDFEAVAQKLMELLRHVGSVSQILTRIQKAVARPADFIALPRAIAYAISVCEVLQQDVRFPLRRRANLRRQQQQQLHRQQPQHPSLDHPPHRHVTQDEPPPSPPPELDPPTEEPDDEAYIDFLDSILGRCHVQVLQQLLGHITSIVDEDATAESDHVIVVRGFSEELDGYKDKYDNLGGIMLVFEKDLIARVPWLRESAKIIFFPQVGFLAALRNHATWMNDFSLPEDFEIVFTEMNVYYFKCLEACEMDKEFGDLNAKSRDLENFIASELEDDILDCDADLRETFSALADLDCILSFADVAAELGYKRPSVVSAQEKCILIRKGGHPLQELLIDENKQFVRNDAAIDSTNRVNIVTGPNFSGKSCYARQVGILTYMAQLGSFLPCEAARISVVDRILSQFSSVETCAVPQSSFQLDLTRMGNVLRTSTPSSLVIIDEFGKGTSPASGIGLLAAALQKLSRVGSLVLCTTHFLEMFSMDILRDGASGIRALQMQVQIPENDSETAVPLFILQQGVAQSSAGLACAKISGVKRSVLERAHEIVTNMKAGRRIEPLMEILRNKLPENEQETAAALVSIDWKEASDEEITNFRERILSL